MVILATFMYGMKSNNTKSETPESLELGTKSNEI